MRYLIFISGNTGSGKSTLTRLLAKQLGWEPFVEEAGKNPYFSEYLRDMKQWGLHVQLHYLARHMRDAQTLEKIDRSVVRDRSFYEGGEIYARCLFEEGIMTQRDWNLYRSLYDGIVRKLPTPDLLVYLKADLEILRRRIADRNRPGENLIRADYLARLNEFYDAWISNFTGCSVLEVSVGNVDFLNRPNDLMDLAERIKNTLGMSQG